MEAIAQTNLDSTIDAAVKMLNAAIPTPSRVLVDLTDPERTNRAILAVALSRTPTYLGAAHLLPVVDAFCVLSGVERVVDLDCQSESTREAMFMTMVGIDLPVSEARRTVSRVKRQLISLGGDVTSNLTYGSDDEIRRVLSDLFGEDSCQSQYLMDCANLDIRAVPTGGATAVAVKWGLCHFAEGLFGFDHLRRVACAALSDYEVSAWHACQFLSDAICDSYVGCAGCECQQTCRALCEGWL